MLFATEKIIVYHSKTEEAMDNWMWENGLTLIVSLAFAVAVVAILLLLTKKRSY